MKVLVISSFFPSSPQDKLPQFLLDQATAFAQQYPDDEFIYLAASRADSSTPTIEFPANLKLYRFSYFWPKRYQILTEYGILSAIKKYRLSILTLPFMFLFEYLAIRKYIKQLQPDYVYSHWMLPQGLLAHKHCTRFNIPHVLTSHSSDIEIMFRMGRLGRSLARRVLKNLTAVNVVSSKGKEFLEANLPPDEFSELLNKLTVLPMGVPDLLPKQVAEYRQKLPDSKNIELLFMGRLAEKKGILYLLDAMSLLVDELPNLHLTLAGEGLMYEEIRQYIERESLVDKVTMTGFVGGQAKIECLAKTDLFILPSFTTTSGDREGLPVTLIENMSCGNLCIATYGSGAEELINDGESGYLIAAEDAQAIATVIRNVLTSSVEVQTMIGNSAQEVSVHLRWNRLIKGYYDFLFR